MRKKSLNRQHSPVKTENQQPKVIDYYEKLPSEVKSRLATLLLTYCEEEHQVESQRIKLCEEDDFEPYAAFSRIDRLNQGFITA